MKEGWFSRRGRKSVITKLSVQLRDPAFKINGNDTCAIDAYETCFGDYVYFKYHIKYSFDKR